MFTTIYRPKKISDFVGNKNLIQSFIQWLLEWSPKEDKINKPISNDTYLIIVNKFK